MRIGVERDGERRFVDINMGDFVLFYALTKCKNPERIGRPVIGHVVGVAGEHILEKMVLCSPAYRLLKATEVGGISAPYVSLILYPIYRNDSIRDIWNRGDDILKLVSEDKALCAHLKWIENYAKRIRPRIREYGGNFIVK